MQWDDLNQPGPYNAFALGQEIEAELNDVLSVPRELTQEELDEYNKVKKSLYRRWALGQWIAWPYTQLIVMTALALGLILST
jgi:hypothetical protein